MLELSIMFWETGVIETLGRSKWGPIWWKNGKELNWVPLVFNALSVLRFHNDLLSEIHSRNLFS
jgi:hypothetical protein